MNQDSISSFSDFLIRIVKEHPTSLVSYNNHKKKTFLLSVSETPAMYAMADLIILQPQAVKHNPQTSRSLP